MCNSDVRPGCATRICDSHPGESAKAPRTGGALEACSSGRCAGRGSGRVHPGGGTCCRWALRAGRVALPSRRFFYSLYRIHPFFNSVHPHLSLSPLPPLPHSVFSLPPSLTHSPTYAHCATEAGDSGGGGAAAADRVGPGRPGGHPGLAGTRPPAAGRIFRPSQPCPALRRLRGRAVFCDFACPRTRPPGGRHGWCHCREIACAVTPSHRLRPVGLAGWTPRPGTPRPAASRHLSQPAHGDPSPPPSDSTPVPQAAARASNPRGTPRHPPRPPPEDGMGGGPGGEDTQRPRAPLAGGAGAGAGRQAGGRVGRARRSQHGLARRRCECED